MKQYCIYISIGIAICMLMIGACSKNSQYPLEKSTKQTANIIIEACDSMWLPNNFGPGGITPATFNNY